jgi:hypothetical protein
MTRRNLLQLIMLSIAIALATSVLAWWTVPVIAGAWGVLADDEDRPALVVSLAAGLSWILLLVWTAANGPITALAARAAGTFEVPSTVLYGITMLFPMAIAWGAAVVGEVASRAVVGSMRQRGDEIQLGGSGE